jgi:hypothetical protein
VEYGLRLTATQAIFTCKLTRSSGGESRPEDESCKGLRIAEINVLAVSFRVVEGALSCISGEQILFDISFGLHKSLLNSSIATAT